MFKNGRKHYDDRECFQDGTYHLSYIITGGRNMLCFPRAVLEPTLKKGLTPKELKWLGSKQGQARL